MTELLTAQQMRDLEHAAIVSGDVTGLELMERAGRGVVQAIFEKWPELATNPHHAVILCGPGNNGGDGFVIARLLAGQGWLVDTFLLGEPAKLPPDARVNHDLWARNNPVQPFDVPTLFAKSRPDVIVDAVFGIGLTRSVPPVVEQALGARATAQWANGNEIRQVAVDCPSGLNLDTGQVLSSKAAAVRADLTVTFHTPKPGHFLRDGPAVCSDVVITDIGLQAYEGCELAERQATRLVGPRELTTAKARWPIPLIAKAHCNGHKYDHGHAMVFAGGVGRGGAGRLAARAALRVGAGLVTVLCPPAALQENAARLDAIMLRALPKDKNVGDVADGRTTAFCVGPGLGVGEQTQSLVLDVLSIEGDGTAVLPAVILDADALSSFRRHSEILFDAIHARTVLTPHDGEFARLFPDLAEHADEGASKIEIVRAAAQRAGCVVLLKGPATVIAAPDGRTSLHAACYDRSAHWLATAGSGDVLAGLISGLGASDPGADMFAVTEAAVWLHVEAALRFGPGLIAEDLPEVLPQVFADLLARKG